MSHKVFLLEQKLVLNFFHAAKQPLNIFRHYKKTWDPSCDFAKIWSSLTRHTKELGLSVSFFVEVHVHATNQNNPFFSKSPDGYIGFSSRENSMQQKSKEFQIKNYLKCFFILNLGDHIRGFIYIISLEGLYWSFYVF